MRTRSLQSFISRAMAVLLAAAALCAAFYLAAEAGHVCEDGDCPVCECLRLCERTLRSVGSGRICLAAAVLPPVFFCLAAVLFVCVSAQDTLISRKIRLNN